MPTVVVLQDVFGRDKAFETLYFLLKEDLFPVNGLRLLQMRIRDESLSGLAKTEDISKVAEETIEELGFTLLPYSLYIIKY